MTDKTFFNDFLFNCLGLGWTVSFTNDDNDFYWYDFTKEGSEYSFRCYLNLPTDDLKDMRKVSNIWIDFCGPGGFEGDRGLDHNMTTPEGFALLIEGMVKAREIEDKLLETLNLN